MTKSKEIKHIIATKQSMIRKLTNFELVVNSTPDKFTDAATLAKLQLHLDTVNNLPEKYEELCIQLSVLSCDEDEIMECEDFYNKCIESRSRATVLLADNSPNSSSQVSNIITGPSPVSCNNAKLTRIAVPSYDGNYTTFTSFYQLFVSLVHNNQSISEVEKFIYLKTSLTGAAAQTIANIQPSGENYKVAFDLICERYNNPKLITVNHIKGIMDLKPIGKPKAEDLRKLLADYSNHIRALENLNIQVEHSAPFIYCILMSKFDAHTKSKFTEFKPRAIPNLSEINNFLQRYCEVLEEVDSSNKDSSSSKPNSFPNQANYYPGNKFNLSKVKAANFKQSFVMTHDKIPCQHCKEDHFINQCPKFLSLAVKQRFDRVTELKLCKNCLRHSSQHPCNSKFNCKICRKRHSTLLHFEQAVSNSYASTSTAAPQNNSMSPPETAINIAPEVTTNTNLACFRKVDVLLSTASVNIRACNNRWYTARVILDSGSHSNFITEEFSQKLGLKAQRVTTQILGINSCSAQSNSAVNVQVASKHNDFKTTLQCLTIPKIAEKLPLQSFDRSYLNIPDNVRLADNKFNESLPIDILIGAGNFYNLMCVGQIALGKGKPILQKTLLGWIISGTYKPNQRPSNVVCANLMLDDCSDLMRSLDNSLQRFWQLEDVQPCSPLSKLSRQEKFCEKHFAGTVYQDDTGRFTVSIPFNSNLSKLGHSKEQAVNRFLHLEKKLLKNPELYAEYHKFIHEYINLGHMSELATLSGNISGPNTSTIDTIDSTIDLSKIPAFYLPHHAVIKSSSLTTKLRVVFDGSAKSTSNISINDTQVVGPVIQDDLFAILLRFRQHKIALTGDIEKMYRQIMVHPSERKFQRILWRDNPNMEMKTYELQTVTYGTASASYLATKCLQQLSKVHSEKFPKASAILNSDFYMDDLLTGAGTVQEVLNLQSELTSILSTAGFPIRKFLSNNSDVLCNDNNSTSFYTVPLGEREHAKMLGLAWNAPADIIQYNTQIKDILPTNSKRTILSMVAQLFDPLGLLSPFVITGKLLIQKLWKSKISWDESIPESLNSEWNLFKSELPTLNLLKIPRCVVSANSISIELHGFSDSSSIAFGACVYVRCVTLHDNMSINLLCSKSRVAPLHGATIPRLELCAAVLLAQLVRKVKKSLSINFHKTFFWSDSTIVLSWINSAPNKYKTFVANRIATIQEISDPQDWCHVPSKQNPADLVSRGSSATELINNSLWWHGPSFLASTSEQWPKSPQSKTDNTPSSELNTNCNFILNLLQIQTSNIFERFSSLSKLKRVVAWIIRFRTNCKLPKSQRIYNELQVVEVQNSLNILITLCQAEAFSQEIQFLRSKRPLKSTSSILSLNPFLDANNIMRVGGRLKNSCYSFDKKFPILLPKDHLFTQLIFKYFHVILLHCGAQQLLACTREYYWPISGRSTAKKTIHSCIKCFRSNPKSYSPLMGDLPAKRVQAGIPVFSHVGIDYAGPILIKDRKLRGSKLIKSYICLFVCLVTKAIHLELVTDLTADAFIAVLKRFICRRGIPISISSDNATNFQGASNELKELYAFFNSRDDQNGISSFMTNQNIKWDFIIPRNPHQGGIWESGVKSVKMHLKKVLGNASLTYEDFSTVLIQIEAALNSRPLSPLSTDPSDTTPLTPGHFLIARSLCAIPEANLVSINENRLTLYQRIQRLLQDFWRRWSLEVVPELQRRTKWFKHMPDLLKIDALALIKEDNLPPLQWLLGRIVEIHSYPDGITRSVTLRISNGHSIKRSVHKLCVLPGV